MKKFLLIFGLLFGFVLQNTFAENYNDIVVYQLPSYAESQAKNFINSIICNGVFYTKQGIKIYIVVLSKGYGLDYQEYKLYSLESKEVITPSSNDYYRLKRLFN
jgi:hypothetical protein